MHAVDRFEAPSLAHVIKDTFIRMILSLSSCRGQCYDGCSTMSGSKSGGAILIKKEELRCLYTHCYAHLLNLACSDTIKKCRVLKDAIDTTNEITNLVKKFPKRDAKLQNIKESMSINTQDNKLSNIRLLCPASWTLQADAFLSFAENFGLLHEL